MLASYLVRFLMIFLDDDIDDNDDIDDVKNLFLGLWWWLEQKQKNKQKKCYILYLIETFTGCYGREVLTWICTRSCKNLGRGPIQTLL